MFEQIIINTINDFILDGCAEPKVKEVILMNQFTLSCYTILKLFLIKIMAGGMATNRQLIIKLFCEGKSFVAITLDMTLKELLSTAILSSLLHDIINFKFKSVTKSRRSSLNIAITSKWNTKIQINNR